MDIKHSIFKRKTLDDRRYKKPWTLRLIFEDQTGTERSKTYQFATKTEALDARPKLEQELSQSQGMSAVGGKMTFADLAEYAKRTFYAPAEIAEGRKIAGIKSHRQTGILIDSLVDYIGSKKIVNITRSDMDGYKSWRLKRGDLRGHQMKLKREDRKQVSLSTVNRGLAIFKRMMKHAFAEGWILRDITKGSKAIDPDAEKARTRILSAAEETFLLACCGSSRTVSYERNGKTITTVTQGENPYLKSAILLGLDAGLRKNEILTLTWSDIDFENELINVQSQHTKTQRGRQVPMPRRLRNELESLPRSSRKGKVFPFNDFKRSWGTALRHAGITGLTFHDLRRTFITKLSANGVPLAIAGKLAGHSSLSTTQKHYVSTDDQSILDQVRQKLDALDGNHEDASSLLN
jgi:integrase